MNHLYITQIRRYNVICPLLLICNKIYRNNVNPLTDLDINGLDTIIAIIEPSIRKINPDVFSEIVFSINKIMLQGIFGSWLHDLKNKNYPSQ